MVTCLQEDGQTTLQRCLSSAAAAALYNKPFKGRANNYVLWYVLHRTARNWYKLSLATFFSDARINSFFVRFEVFTAATVKNGVFSDRVALVRTHVSEELSASIIRVTRIGKLGTTFAVTSNRRTLRRNTKRTLPFFKFFFCFFVFCFSYNVTIEEAK
jgi:hypothetical protein